MVKFLFFLLAAGAELPRYVLGSTLFPGLIGLSGAYEQHNGQSSQSHSRNQNLALPQLAEDVKRLRGRSGPSQDISQQSPADFVKSAPQEALPALIPEGSSSIFSDGATKQYQRHHLHISPESSGSVLMNTSVLQRGIEELDIAASASQAAQMDSKSTFTSQQEFAAKIIREQAQKSYNKVKGKSVEMRSQQLLVRLYAARAQMYANHARKVAWAARDLVDEAAAKALQATKDWIASDAKQAAETKAADQAANSGARTVDKIAAAVAVAAEPCHLTLLRTQKFCAETYATAQGTQTSMKELMVKAHNVALRAQELQSSGMGLDAQSTMMVAHGMMQEAENMRQRGLILYKQANSACNSLGYYEQCEQQAAASAAASQIINAPMKLPTA